GLRGEGDRRAPLGGRRGLPRQPPPPARRRGRVHGALREGGPGAAAARGSPAGRGRWAWLFSLRPSPPPAPGGKAPAGAYLIGTSYTRAPSRSPSFLPSWQAMHCFMTTGTTVAARNTGLPSLDPTSS